MTLGGGEIASLAPASGRSAVTVRVKICGVNSPAAFDAAAEAGADWVGFVFHRASPRYVKPSGAARLSGRLLAGPARVGLFVDPTNDELAEATDALRLHALQIYAPVERIARIRAIVGIPVWRPIAVQTQADLPDDGGVAAALVVEARKPPGAVTPGGNGVAMDWSLLRGWQPATTWLVAGGLRPDNVAQAVRESGARAVDVSSGVESAPGVKDPVLIAAFIRAARHSWRDGGRAQNQGA